MDNKRLLLATALCFLVLMGWQSLAEYMGWVQAPAPVEQIAESRDTAQPVQSLSQPLLETPKFAPGAGREVRVDTPLYSAVFHSAGGVLQSFTLKHYQDVIGPDAKPLEMVSARAATVSPMGLLVNGQPSWSVGEWAFDGTDITLNADQSASLTFTGMVHGIRVTRVLSFRGDGYLIAEETKLASENMPIPVKLGYTLATTSLSGTSSYDAMNMAWDLGGSLKTEADVDDLTQEGALANGDMYWVGVMSNYFLAALAPAQTGEAVFKGRVTEDGIWRAALEKQDLELVPGTELSVGANWWIGPKDRAMLQAAPNDLADSVNMGMFGVLALPLLWLLTFFQSLVTNWGVAIILLTLLIKILFWPLTRKSYKSMEAMKKLQPQMKALQDKHAGDKEALSREMMQLYKTYGVNPMGGCLPILIQMPVFIALYQALLHSIELRHAVFISYLPGTDMLWLADLSVKDPYYITPLIMGVTMFLQQWMSPAVGDPTQRKVMLLMPVIFTVMFLQFPAGLVLYWLCNNVLSIAQQWWTLHKA